MHNGQTCMADGHTTKNAHEPFFGELAIHNFMHDQSSKHTSPTIMHSDQTTYQTIPNAHNDSITWRKQSYHHLGKSLARSSNCQD